MGKRFDSERGKYKSPDGSRTWEYLSAFVCATGTFCVGSVMGWNSPSLNELTSPNSPIPTTPGEASTLAAVASVGTLIAFPLSVVVVDRIGRRNSIMLSGLPMIISWGMIVLAKTVEVLIMARIICGISLGLIISTVPIYMAEILSSDIRGSLGAMGGIMAYSGVLFMFGVAPHLGLQITACCGIGFSLIFMISFWFVPESPYFLLKVGRIGEAEKALKKLRGKTDVADELELIKATLKEKGKSLLTTGETEDENGSEKRQSAFKQLLTIRGNLRAFIIGFVLMTMQHFCGFQMIVSYCHMILKDMGSKLDVYIASLIFSILQIITAGMNVLVVDRFGRRTLLFVSGTITIILLTIIATYFYLMEHMDMDVKEYSTIPLISVFVLVVALNFGVMSIPATVQAEIYAPDIKMLGNCIVGLTGSIMTIISTKSYLLMATSWGFGHSVPFFGFAIITFLCLAFVARYLPETKGKTLLQIQKELNA